ncbi:universal stress protein [Chitinophagales bacterium]|nr:universal stress protein [Chitinophagales bacterium]
MQKLRIVIPTDFSACSEEAIKYALLLAKESPSELFLLHFCAAGCTDGIVVDQSNYEVVNPVVKEIQSHFDAIEERFDFEEIPIHRVIVTGDIQKSIDSTATAKRADLIIMGTHGVSGVKEWAIGSTTQKMIRQTGTPIIAVKECPSTLNLKELVFISDFNLEHKPSFKKFTQFAEQFNSKITLLSIDTPAYFSEVPFITKRAMEEFSELYKGETKMEFADGWTVEIGLEHYLEDNDVGLACISTHGHKGLRGLFFTSIAEGIVNHMDYPVMVVNNSKQH